jgi:hypothetical protein
MQPDPVPALPADSRAVGDGHIDVVRIDVAQIQSIERRLMGKCGIPLPRPEDGLLVLIRRAQGNRTNR